MMVLQNRTVRFLQEKYKQIKKELRKEDADQKKHMTATGGGKYKKPRVLTEEETKSRQVPLP